MAGKQVLRIETRERLKPGNARHVAGLARDPASRPMAEPVIVLGGGGGHKRQLVSVAVYEEGG